MEITGGRSGKRLVEDFFSGNDGYLLRKTPFFKYSAILDIGANLGLYSMMARFLCPTARIIAIEPHKQVYDVLLRNAANLRIECHRLALGNGNKVFLRRGKSALANLYVEDGANQEESCNSAMLPDIIQRFDIPLSYLCLKIDCEGAEYFMKGDAESENVLKKARFIILEVHSRQGEGWGCSAKAYIKWIRSLLKGTHDVILTRRGVRFSTLNAISRRM